MTDGDMDEAENVICVTKWLVREFADLARDLWLLATHHGNHGQEDGYVRRTQDVGDRQPRSGR